MTARSIKRINYQFSSAGLTRGAAEDHAEYAARALRAVFRLKEDQVRVSYRSRLPENAPHVLTVYVGASDTDQLLMIQAAKVVLPHLRVCQEQAAIDLDWLTENRLVRKSRHGIQPWRLAHDAFLTEHGYLETA